MIRSFKMLAPFVVLLFFVLLLHFTAAAPLISPGSESQEHIEDKSTAKFHLVANTDVTMRVSSKGLVYVPNQHGSRSCART